MPVATVLSREQRGIDAPQVRVEVNIGPGLPTFNIVGLPEAAVKESKDRVRAALTNSDFQFPSGRITVNLAPADLPKEGGRFDLPIAIGIVSASDQLTDVRSELQACELYGELSLSGELRSMRGLLPAALAASVARHSVVVPHINAAEAALVKDCEVIAASCRAGDLGARHAALRLVGSRLPPCLESGATILGSAAGDVSRRNSPDRGHYRKRCCRQFSCENLISRCNNSGQNVLLDKYLKKGHIGMDGHLFQAFPCPLL
jgi:hypothetical protein